MTANGIQRAWLLVSGDPSSLTSRIVIISGVLRLRQTCGCLTLGAEVDELYLQNTIKLVMVISPCLDGIRKIVMKV